MGRLRHRLPVGSGVSDRETLRALAPFETGAMPQLEQHRIRNRLLGALQPDDYARLAPALERIPLPLRETVVGANQPIDYAYFPEEGFISFVADTQSGRIEIGLVGREGLVGMSLVLGSERSPYVGTVQAPGEALRIPAAALRDALDASRELRGVLGRYVQAYIVQIGQTVYANAELTIEGRLARWILMVQDRLEQGELPLTHEFLSMMLGVRRPGVTTAVHMLEGTGMIRAKRGRITVLDREKLRDLAGDAYGFAEAEYERLLAET
jgi:CRP-like cAMP-binding protein